MRGNQCAINSPRFTATTSRGYPEPGCLTDPPPTRPFSVGPDGPAAILPENHFNLPSHTQSPSHILCIDVSHLSRRIHAFYSARENCCMIYATNVSALHLHKLQKKLRDKGKLNRYFCLKNIFSIIYGYNIISVVLLKQYKSTFAEI